MAKTTPKTSEIVWEWIYLFFCVWYVVGIYVDGYFHVHDPSLESFFTPWHAILYSGYALTTLILLAWTIWNRQKTFRTSIPAGHGLSLIGAFVFLLGGVGDMVWHIVFGVEADIDALLSPTHLMLALGAALVFSGGARHFWATKQNTGSFWKAIPLIFSLAFTFATVTFMTQFAHYTDPDFTGMTAPEGPLLFYRQAVPLLGIVFFSALLVGTISAGLRRGRLPFGSVTVILTTVVTGMSVMRSGTEVIPAAIFAGFLGDLLVWRADRTVTSALPIRLLSILLPATYTLLMLATLTHTQGVWMSVHMWTGAVVFSGFAGYLTGLVAWPRSRKPAVALATATPKKRVTKKTK
jgi:hypothetical protein